MWITDPKTGQKSVSLSLMIVSFCSIIGCSFAKVTGNLESTGPLLELFYATAALYFGRRFKGKGEIGEDRTSIKEDS